MSASSVYVDSNVFIGPVLYGDIGRARAATRVLRYIEQGRIVAYTSVLTWDEVVWVVLRTVGKADSLSAGKKLLHFPNLRFVPVTEELLVRAQKLVEDHELAPRDAVHCASAMSKGVQVVISGDADLDAVPGLKRESPEAFRPKS
ncbi:MAG: type II toxin-antitoxin system VapC family toxin [Nitrososphaerales archaeon]|nr:type II toxin-antitoxin system VapC family toxin [Nitrososphaerales archaeon]